MLLNAALEVFYEKGVEKATLSAIVDRAGMTRGALYWHFEGKQHLLEQICTEFIESDLHRLQQVLNAEQVWQALGTMLKEQFREMTTDLRRQQFVGIMFCQGGGINPGSNIVGRHFRRYHRMWSEHGEKILTKARENREIPAETDLTWALLHLDATCTGLLRMLFNPERAAECALYTDRIIETTMQLIAAGPGQTTTSNL